jgi:hypothetical protein
MTQCVEERASAIRYRPGRLSVVGGFAASTAGWLLVLTGLVGIVALLPGLGWDYAIYLLALCVAPQAAMWTTRQVIAARRIRSHLPTAMLTRRYHGDPAAITDSERRPLRPIGTTAGDVTIRTATLLADLIDVPSVRIFCSVQSPGTHLPLVSHAVTAGRRLLLVESVVWPPGCYRIDRDGKVRCDGVYIGQSVRPLVEAVSHWRRLLPRTHHVSGLVIVHRWPGGEYVLPDAGSESLAWVAADDAVVEIRRHISRHRQTVSRHAVAALIAATASPSN